MKGWRRKSWMVNDADSLEPFSISLRVGASEVVLTTEASHKYYNYQMICVILCTFRCVVHTSRLLCIAIGPTFNCDKWQSERKRHF